MNDDPDESSEARGEKTANPMKQKQDYENEQKMPDDCGVLPPIHTIAPFNRMKMRFEIRRSR